MTIETKGYVEQLKEAGYEAAEAETLVNNYVSALENDVMKDGDDNTRESVLRQKIHELTRAGDKEKFEGIVLGVSNRDDANSYAKYVALQAYDANKKKAVSEGLVRVENGVPIPLDNEKTRRKADGSTYSNPKFGTPIPKRMQRTAMMLIDGKVHRVYGDFNMSIGHQVSLQGKMNDKGYITCNPPPQPRTIRILGTVEFADETDAPKDEFFNAFMEAAQTDDAMCLAEALLAPKNTFLITQGTVSSIVDNSNGLTMYVNDDDVDGDIACFSNSDEVRDFMTNIVKGSRVIFVGRLGHKEFEGEIRKNFSVLGVTTDPSSLMAADALARLDNI